MQFPYDFHESPQCDTRVAIGDPIGRTLAEALGGRWSSSESAHYLTPARARYWRTLYEADWEAVKGKRLGMTMWLFRRERRTYLLGKALKICNQSNAITPVAAN